MTLLLESAPSESPAPTANELAPPIEPTRHECSVKPISPRGLADRDIRDSVRMLFHYQNTPSRITTDRRQNQRHPYPYPIELTPMDGDVPLTEQTFAVLGKHLSEYGLDFYCDQPLPYRRVIAWFEPQKGRRIGLLLDLSWCRFNKFGWYENGGRFLQVVRTAA
ncbi:MAG: hypothetical protein KDA59_15090 [Planctomycetales bacterium]|nr:hypothetical protein [Planctomycetales bacterium]MCA9204377.1 hypothetical protein [Planctomycetales bacterium]